MSDEVTVYFDPAFTAGGVKPVFVDFALWIVTQVHDFVPLARRGIQCGITDRATTIIELALVSWAAIWTGD